MASSVVDEEILVLERWRKIDAFRRQLELTKDHPRYSFYDGPPFATGLPHHGHLLTGTIKDIIPRYWSMKGYHVERRFGWDTHGLPIEHEIDKKFNLYGKEAVLKMGMKQYNEECKSIVTRYTAEWREMVERAGRWVDFDHDYKTMDVTFMESCWWVFKRLFDQGQVYRGRRVMPYSTVLATSLSNLEAAQNHMDVLDPAIVVSFPLIEDPETHLLAWTTTPWTLPSNLSVAVHPDFEYIKIHDKKFGKNFFLLEKLLGTLYKKPTTADFHILSRLKGSDMLGWKYEPLFKHYYEEYKDVAYKVVNATYVTDTSGVGIVHQAPAFGEEDYKTNLEAGIISAEANPPDPFDDQGRFTEKIPEFLGLGMKEANKAIIKHLKSAGRLVVEAQISHSYPMCPRSNTPLMNRAIPAWFIRVADIVPRMLKNLAKTHWVPQPVKEGRFANWIANAYDWNVSRSRYWGTPIPIWVSDDFEECVCVGSIAELVELSGWEGTITDIHRDHVDQITIPSKMGKGTLRRVEEVFDCWFESGSMPYAMHHYPFENKETFQSTFPANFIAEGLDQTRGWFYTLLILGTHLFDCSPFQNCIVNGLILGNDGQKMSKSRKNYTPARETIDKYGADAVRLYMINSPVVRGEPLLFKDQGVKHILQAVLIPFWNCYNFFQEQVARLKKMSDKDFSWTTKTQSSNTNVMDRWILASCQSLIEFVNQEMEAYRLSTVVPRLINLINQTTNWYIRFNRKRLKGEVDENETVHALNTLFDVLFTLCRGLAPFAPFITDRMYLCLLPYIPVELQAADNRSVHFLSYPSVRHDLFDPVIERRMGRLQKVIELVRNSRDRATVTLKMPLKTLVVVHRDRDYLEDLKFLEPYLLQELNVMDLILTSDEAKHGVTYSVTADWPVLGKKLKKDMPRVKNALSRLSNEEVQSYIANKHIVVDGVQLQEGDLIVRRSIEKGTPSDLEINTDNDVITLLDVKRHPEVVDEWIGREIINRVQKLRKKAGLKSTDDVEMEYQVLKDSESICLENAFASQAEAFKKALRGSVLTRVSESNASSGVADIMTEEEQEIQEATFLLRFLRMKT